MGTIYRNNLVFGNCFIRYWVLARWQICAQKGTKMTKGWIKLNRWYDNLKGAKRFSTFLLVMAPLACFPTMIMPFSLSLASYGILLLIVILFARIWYINHEKRS
ncbi:hypothetical protein LCGC14_0220120 [marine sediment metagenome]|uniref:Uncharacterized protein n=1 Tax=marine sediment metagenome TaxID=412755 RepID=A0A0F9UUH0_9ZZZZ